MNLFDKLNKTLSFIYIIICLIYIVLGFLSLIFDVKLEENYIENEGIFILLYSIILIVYHFYKKS